MRELERQVPAGTRLATSQGGCQTLLRQLVVGGSTPLRARGLLTGTHEGQDSGAGRARSTVEDATGKGRRKQVT